MDRREASLTAQQPNIDDRTVRDALSRLIEVTRDGEESFAHAAEHVEDPAVAARLREFGVRRGELADELVEVGSSFGLGDEGGSVLGDIRRTWMSLQAAVTSGDHAVLSAAEEGEDRAVEAYESALDEALPPQVESVLRRQLAAVQGSHVAVRALRDSTR